MSAIALDILMFLGLAGVSSVVAVGLTVAVIWVRHRTRPATTAVPPAHAEMKKITSLHPDACDGLEFLQNASQKAVPQPAPSAPPVAPPDAGDDAATFVPLQIRVCFRREEWHLRPAERLIPRAHWN